MSEPTPPPRVKESGPFIDVLAGTLTACAAVSFGLCVYSFLWEKGLWSISGAFVMSLLLFCGAFVCWCVRQDDSPFMQLMNEPPRPDAAAVERKDEP